jgi:hypothetical protein
MLFLTVLLACAGTNSPPAHDHGPGADHTHEEPAEAKAAGNETHYGDAFATEKVIPVGTFLDNPDDFVDQTIRVSGRVTDVCQKAGCWMVIADEDRHIRVTMKDHAFAVDKTGAGNDCEVEGVVTKTAIDPERVAHFESESAEGAVIPEKQAKDDVVYEIEASGVTMRKGS